MTTITAQLTLGQLNIDTNVIDVPSTIKVVRKQNIGDIVDYGRYKGTKAVERYIIISGEIDEILDFTKHLNYNVGNCEMSLDLNVEFTEQCNFELSMSQLKKISLLNLDLSISCYQGCMGNE